MTSSRAGGCDIRLCSSNATFGLAETRWAIIPGAGGTQRLPRGVTRGALEMILTGDPTDAETALRHGLVNRIVERCAAQRGAPDRRQGAVAVRAAKQAVKAGLTLGLEQGLAEEARLFHEVLRTDDAVEGATAFAEKRDPVYRGR